jgi:hypothetical protein
MSNAVSFMDITRQHVELLPARTVLSMVCCTPSTGTTAANGTAGTTTTTATPTATGTSSAGGTGSAPVSATGNPILIFFVAGNQYNTLTSAAGSTGAAAAPSTVGTATGGVS